jgi:hypothetical protein
VFDVITLISIFSIAIPLSCCLIRFRSLNKELGVLFLYIIVSVATEVISFVLRTGQNSNTVIQNLFTVIECSLITYIYFLRFETSRFRAILKLGYGIFLSLVLIIFGLMRRINSPDNLVSSYEACFFIALSWLYFYKLIRDKHILKLNQYYFAWINSAILIYFSMAFFLFLFNKFIGTLDISLYAIVYTPHLITNISFNILLGIGVWKIKQK